MSTLREELLEAQRNGTFLQAAYDSYSPDDGERQTLVALADLHNERLIDVVAEFRQLRNKSPSLPDFFLTRHIFETVLPDLKAPVKPVMECVLQLYRDAGNDWAAADILKGFAAFCARDPARAVDALKEIEADPDAFMDLLPTIIDAGSQGDTSLYIAEVIRLSKSSNIELRRRAVFAIANLKWTKGATVPDELLSTLEHSAQTETDDHVLGGVVRSSFALYQQDKALEARAIALIATALAKGGDNALHAASMLFGFSTKDLPPPLLDLLLKELKRVVPTNNRTMGCVGLGLSHLLKDGPQDGAIQFLEDFLTAHPESVNLEDMSTAISTIRENGALISKVLTRWLLRGDRVLCETVHHIAGTHHGEDLQIKIDPAELRPLDLVHIVFVARKAIGYFFLKPITATSIVVSLMRVAPDDETLHTLGELLLEPLLLNYSGVVRDHVKDLAGKESGKLKEVLDGQLQAIDSYLDTLHSIGKLPALYPGEAQREAHNRHTARQMAESLKAAEKNSVILNLVSRSTLLYGRKSIYFVHGPNGESRRMETELHNHGVEWEVPRMENIDPYGLDYMLRVFRHEKFRA